MHRESPKYQKKESGRKLVIFDETILIKKGCPKLNIQIRTENIEAMNFYKRVGYTEDAAVSFGKRLIED